MTIAARAALRVLPLLEGADDVALIVLPLFRATSIVRFAAKYPNRAIEASADAGYAAGSVEIAVRYADVAAANAAADAANAADCDADIASVAAFAAKAAAASHAGYANAAYARTAVQAAAAATNHDAQRLHDGVLTADQLARDQLWPISTPAEFKEAWQRLRLHLIRLSPHWVVWTDWYENVALHKPYPSITEAQEAAFTDIPGKLPWDDGAEAVNTEIARRLQALRESGPVEQAVPVRLDSEGEKAKTLARLAEVASPQPSLTDKGKLDAGPNRLFDVPTVDDDLSTLPIRQRNLIKGILDDLPANAPKHLKKFLRAYDDELKVRGAQPILGLLKDDADIIAAAVSARRAEDEWLEPGMRKAFDRFHENHILFIEHFPLDAEREAVYAGTGLDEDAATGHQLIEPFELMAKAATEAHKAGAATDDFLAVIDKMTEFARVVATQPPALPPDIRHPAALGEIRISPEDRLQSVTTKKRVILGALGFLNGTYAVIGTTVTIATASYAGVLEALKPAIEMLSRFLR